MKKLKGFYQNNRIYCILMIVSIVCIILIASAFVYYFIEQTRTDVYGKRLYGIGVSLVQNLVISLCIFCFENGKIKRCLHSIKKCFIGLCKKKASEFAYDLLNENERKKHLLSVTFNRLLPKPSLFD